MQKFILIVSTLILLSFYTGYSQNRKINFIDKPWQEIVAMSKQENKLIFLDAYASWCGPCKWIAANMFTNDSIADYYNRTFICASIDMEKGEGPILRRKYMVNAYPSLIFINQDENMVHERVGGLQKVQDYITMGKVAQNPDECLAACVKKYKEGNTSPQFIQTYLLRLSEAYIPVDAVLKKYLSTQTDTDLLTRVNLNIIFRFVTDLNDPVFDFLYKHQAEYAKLSTKDSVKAKITDVMLTSLRLARRNPNSKTGDSIFKATKTKIMAYNFEGAGKAIFSSDLEWLQSTGKSEDFLNLAYNDLDKYYDHDYYVLQKTSQMVSSMTNEQKYLDKALSWAKQSVSLKPEPANTDNYASILFKTGKKEEAIKQEKNAIDLAKKWNITTTQYEESLKRMEESK
jgi:thiol-disulfide isomerase/thioredoxin